MLHALHSQYLRRFFFFSTGTENQYRTNGQDINIQLHRQVYSSIPDRFHNADYYHESFKLQAYTTNEVIIPIWEA